MLEPVERAMQRAGHGQLATLALLHGAQERAPAIFEHVAPQRDPVTLQQRLQAIGLPQQVTARALVRMLGQPAAVRVAEHVLEEQLAVAAVGFEQQHVGAGIALLVILHADQHA